MYQQNYFDNYEQSESDLVEQALSMPLQRKIDRAIAMFREYSPKSLVLSEFGYYLAFSGGKDSCVIKQLAVESGVPFKAFFNNTTIEHPETYKFIRQFHSDVVWHNPSIPFYKLVEKKGLPRRNARWCCEALKENCGNGLFKVVGVRICESSRRAKVWREILDNRNSGKFFAPICYWTDKDVWSFIRDRHLNYCSLYDCGYSRIGCVGCPMSRNRAAEFASNPKIMRAWMRAAKIYHDMRISKGSASTSFSVFWDNWLNEDNQSDFQCVFDEMLSNR